METATVWGLGFRVGGIFRDDGKEDGNYNLGFGV